MLKRARIAVFVSGGGTNLEALLQAQERGDIPHGQIVLVCASNPNAYALTRAANHGVDAAAFSKKQMSQADFESALTEKLEAYHIDLIILAGFLSILSAEFTARWDGRILNVHPSLIPAFCGKGFYGLHVHEAVLARGCKVTGATAHLVTAGVDEGPILLQKAVDVLPGDTPEILQRRVMEQAEWLLLPRAVRMLSEQVEGEK